MNTISPATPMDTHRFQAKPQAPRELKKNTASEPASRDSGNVDSSEQRKAFEKFVGTTFYGQLLSAMRKTVDKSAYFHGGRAEEVFQGQLDQILADRMSEATADQFAGPMYEIWQMKRTTTGS